MMNRHFYILGCLLVLMCVEWQHTEHRPASTVFPLERHVFALQRQSGPKRPNILVLLTDQERHPRHWPEGWAAKHLPNRSRLKRHGLVFENAFTSASECSPSRAVLVSGNHYPVNNVPETLNAKKGNPLPTYEHLQSVGTVLRQAGYQVLWKGKWHLTLPVDGEYKWSKKDVHALQARYGLAGWNPPDAGDAITNIIKDQNGTFSGLLTLGGGTANNDGRYTFGPRGVLPELDELNPDEPFCLFVSLVNPHDVWVYPHLYEQAGYFREAFENLGIALPPNAYDDLATKPSIQKKAREAFDKASPLRSQQERETYCNFYAYLHTLNDAHIGAILDKLDARGLTENTVIIRTADHGEMGLSHGLREKAYVLYDEVINVPLIISNPRLFPEPRVTDALYCHLDLLPTLMDIVGLSPDRLPGKSLLPVLLGTATDVQDSILFTYDDTFFLPAGLPNSHIRAIRTKEYVYGVYYNAAGEEQNVEAEYEMYDIEQDPQQLTNLMYQRHPGSHPLTARLHQQLLKKVKRQNPKRDPR